MSLLQRRAVVGIFISDNETAALATPEERPR